MPEPQKAPYGSWSSPITSDLIVAASIGLGEIQLGDGRRAMSTGSNRARRRAADRFSSVAPPTAPLPT